MKIALVHYHLRTGGVTKVIGNQSTALSALGHEHLILSAGPAPNGLPHIEESLLDYLDKEPEKPGNLYQTLLAHCIARFGAPPDLWHIHNHSLGKNILFPQLIKDIAESETAIVLQPHDFAEDNRPSNYHLLTGKHFYPVAPQVHYAFINSRDQNLLEAAGLPKQNSHLLPNAVAPPTLTGVKDSPTHPLVLYPVRGIRRKNLGEAVLLASLAPEGTRFAVSLAPENPIWQDVHQGWEDFARDNEIPIEFAVTNQVDPKEGEKSDFQSWLNQATHLLSTSIAEGFGLAFLEPAALGKPLLGRDLPEITKDFWEQGIAPGRFYERIPIPLDRIDQEELRNEFDRQVSDAYRLYAKELSLVELDLAWNALTANNEVDFGALPEPFQKKLIRDSIKGPSKTFDKLRKWLAKTLAETEPTAAPESLARYSLAQSQKDLAALYQATLSEKAQAPTWLSKDKVLGQYLSPSRFHFLRS